MAIKERIMKQIELNELLLEAYQAGYETADNQKIIPFRVWFEVNEERIKKVRL